jgi:holliday junction DNA helicase RuvA
MIAFVRGLLAQVGPRTGSCWAIVDVGGVGYQVWTHSRTTSALPPLGEEVKIFTHMIVREDATQLFGFLDLSERELFGKLIGVSGIGPRMGLALLDTLKPPELVQAILQGNSRVLALAPGVGTKTAERLALELRSQLAKWRGETELAVAGTRGHSKVTEDVELALLALGYTPNEVASALNAIAPQLVNQNQTDVWLRSAIAWLAEQD